MSTPPGSEDFEQPFRFLDLPQELQDKILQHYYNGRTRIVRTTVAIGPKWQATKPRLGSQNYPLDLVNKHIRESARPMKSELPIKIEIDFSSRKKGKLPEAKNAVKPVLNIAKYYPGLLLKAVEVAYVPRMCLELHQIYNAVVELARVGPDIETIAFVRLKPGFGDIDHGVVLGRFDVDTATRVSRDLCASDVICGLRLDCSKQESISGYLLRERHKLDAWINTYKNVSVFTWRFKE